MSLFASLGQGDIWALSGISFASAINDILDRENFTLEILLEEDELIQEVKSKNDVLLDFLCQESTIEQLVKFIIEPSSPSDSDMRKFKYPYMSCEVICCEIPEVLNNLVELDGGKYLKKLFSMLSGRGTLDNYLSGYFEKILEMLFRRMTVPLMKFINESGLSLLTEFLNHMDNYSIMQIVQRLMLPHIPFCNQTDSEMIPYDELKDHYQCNWSYIDESCMLLLDRLFDIDSPDIPMHISDLLITVLQLSPPETLVIKRLCDKSCVCRLLSYSVSDGAEISNPAESLSGTGSVCLASISVLESLISRLFESSLPFEHLERERELDNEHLVDVKQNIDAICEQILEFIPKIDSILRGYMSSVTVNDRLGHRGLQLVKLIEAVVRIANPVIDSSMCASGLFRTCIDLFYHFHNNSLLHLSIQRIFITIIESDSNRSVSQLFILDQCDLMKAIVTTVSGYDSRGEVLSTKMKNEGIDNRYFASRHSSVMGNAILIAQALSLALEVDAQNMNTELSDILEREFVNGEEIDSVSQNSGSVTEIGDNSRKDLLETSLSFENQFSLRYLFDKENLLTLWDIFVEEKLRPILEHQIGGNPYPSNAANVNTFSDQENNLKLGVDFDMYRADHDEDDDDDDEDDFATQGIAAQRFVESHEADIWGDDYFEEETKFESSVVQPKDEKLENNIEEEGTQVTGTFDFAGFADFDSFNDATQPFNNESVVTADFGTSDFAKLSEEKDDDKKNFF